MLSFADYLRPIAPALPPQLISPAAYANILTIAAHLPPAFACGLAGFECRLGEVQAAADFIPCATAAYGGRTALARFDPPLSALAGGIDLRRQHIQTFAQHWADPTSPLYQRIDNVWLEFDLVGRPDVGLVPSILFGLQPPDPAASATTDLAIILEAAHLLNGRPLAAPVIQRLTACMAALPETGSVAFVGVMLGRATTAVRLVLSGLSFAQIQHYVPHVGWPGTVHQVQTAVARATAFSDFAWLHLDVGATVGPRLGVEHHFYGAAQPRQEPRWAAFLTHLVGQGQCTAAKQQALLAYVGRAPYEPAPLHWPADLRLVGDLFGPLGFTEQVRALHNIKLVYHPCRAAEAKAYLSLYYQ